MASPRELTASILASALRIFDADVHHQQQHRMIHSSALQNYIPSTITTARRWLELSDPTVVTTDNSADDIDIEDDSNDEPIIKSTTTTNSNNSTTASSITPATSPTTTTTTIQKQSTNNELCTPRSECELCPHNYKVLIEKEDEKIKGDSCSKYGRRRLFDCTVLFQGKCLIVYEMGMYRKIDCYDVSLNCITHKLMFRNPLFYLQKKKNRK